MQFCDGEQWVIPIATSGVSSLALGDGWHFTFISAPVIRDLATTSVANAYSLSHQVGPFNVYIYPPYQFTYNYTFTNNSSKAETVQLFDSSKNIVLTTIYVAPYSAIVGLSPLRPGVVGAGDTIKLWSMGRLWIVGCLPDFALIGRRRRIADLWARR